MYYNLVNPVEMVVISNSITMYEKCADCAAAAAAAAWNNTILKITTACTDTTKNPNR